MSYLKGRVNTIKVKVIKCKLMPKSHDCAVIALHSSCNKPSCHLTHIFTKGEYFDVAVTSST